MVDRWGSSDILEGSKKIEKTGGSAFSTVQLEVACRLYPRRILALRIEAEKVLATRLGAASGLDLGSGSSPPGGAGRRRVLQRAAAPAAPRGGATVVYLLESFRRGIPFALGSVVSMLKVGA